MTIRALLLAVACLALAGCDLRENVELSEQAVAAFHAKYTAALLGDMYDDVAADIRREETRAEFAKAVGAIRDQLGPVRATRRVGFETTTGSDGAFVQIEYQTEFENGVATEEFVWVIADGHALLKSYQVTTKTLP
jgi:hypothetical protein